MSYYKLALIAILALAILNAVLFRMSLNQQDQLDQLYQRDKSSLNRGDQLVLEEIYKVEDRTGSKIGDLQNRVRVIEWRLGIDEQ